MRRRDGPSCPRSTAASRAAHDADRVDSRGRLRILTTFVGPETVMASEFRMNHRTIMWSDFDLCQGTVSIGQRPGPSRDRISSCFQILLAFPTEKLSAGNSDEPMSVEVMRPVPCRRRTSTEVPSSSSRVQRGPVLVMEWIRGWNRFPKSPFEASILDHSQESGKKSRNVTLFTPLYS